MVKIYSSSIVKDEKNSLPMNHTKSRGPVKIYLRSILKDAKNRLAMFDTSRSGAIDDLITHVPIRGTVIWKLDRFSGIKSITKIYLKDRESKVFKGDPKKLLLCKGFQAQISESADPKKDEPYTIEYILSNGTKVVIDPCIRPDPPKLQE